MWVVLAGRGLFLEIRKRRSEKAVAEVEEAARATREAEAAADVA